MKFGIAIVGFGVVGRGTAELLDHSRELIKCQSGLDLEVVAILDLRRPEKERYRRICYDNMEEILALPNVNLIVEAIGGCSAAKTFTEQALMSGRSVVTSNKELVSKHGNELTKLARDNHVQYLYEASVGGGIPLIRVLSTSLLGNEIRSLRGILNGTTNFILTHMASSSMEFAPALQEAIARGYAELNPVDDIAGLDTRRKLAILLQIVTGLWLHPDKIPVIGIEEIDAVDLDFAAVNNLSLRLLAKYSQGRQGAFSALVAPHFLPNSSPLATVNGVFNALLLNGDFVGDVMLYGRGAGAQPTASAVVADIINCLTGNHAERLSPHTNRYISMENIDLHNQPISAIIRLNASVDFEVIGKALSDLGLDSARLVLSPDMQQRRLTEHKYNWIITRNRFPHSYDFSCPQLREEDLINCRIQPLTHTGKREDWTWRRLEQLKRHLPPGAIASIVML